ncbi:MAG: acyltransferase [Flavobacteriaceae bacterium]|jgi:acetyltransferase-like isoleucine patch superfamily enzyme|nr:acyltransferase [Flavobacteriaceae bacterium]
MKQFILKVLFFNARVILKLIKFKNTCILQLNKNVIANDLIIGDYCNFSIHKKVKKVEFGENVGMRSYCSIYVGRDAYLKIDKGVYINHYTSINCLERIEIGENTLIGEGVKIYDGNHKYTKGQSVEKNVFSKAPVKIGKNCWLGSNVTILKGVTIGDNSIIGAGCLIYKDVPENTIVKLNQDIIAKHI